MLGTKPNSAKAMGPKGSIPQPSATKKTMVGQKNLSHQNSMIHPSRKNTSSKLRESGVYSSVLKMKIPDQPKRAMNHSGLGQAKKPKLQDTGTLSSANGPMKSPMIRTIGSYNNTIVGTATSRGVLPPRGMPNMSSMPGSSLKKPPRH